VIGYDDMHLCRTCVAVASALVNLSPPDSRVTGGKE
jgi:hypothetical protein